MIEAMNESKRTDLINTAASGDLDALQCLIVEHHAALRTDMEKRIAARYRASIDPDDVLQDAYVAAFRSIGGNNFANSVGFHAWLERIAINKLKDHLRALRSAKRDVARVVQIPHAMASSYVQLSQRLFARDSTPSSHFARQETAAAVVSSLARLTDDQREVIRLRFLEGKPVAEIAVRMGKTEVAVYSLLRRALRALREILGSITRFLSRP